MNDDLCERCKKPFSSGSHAKGKALGGHQHWFVLPILGESDDNERTYTEDEYINYGAVQYRRGRAQAEYEAAHPLPGAVEDREPTFTFVKDASDGHGAIVVGERSNVERATRD